MCVWGGGGRLKAERQRERRKGLGDVCGSVGLCSQKVG